MINTETNYRWFIFYQDQLLLEKNDNAFSIPTGKNAPVTTPEGITSSTYPPSPRQRAWYAKLSTQTLR